MKEKTSRRKGSAHRIARTVVATVACAALIVCLSPLSQAIAYYNFGTVSVSTGSTSLSVTVGSSVSTSVSVSPSSDSQTLGCGMAKCPQVCTDDDVIEAGYTCFDSNGQCTCAGKSYSTYYPELAASSSDSTVATAYVSGNTLVVTGVAAGTATITLDASLRQWTSSSTSVSVTVTAASSSSSSSGSSSSSSSGSGSSSSGSSSSSSSGSGSSSSSSGSSSSGSSSSGSSSSSSSSSSADVTIPEEAESTDSVDDELNETVVETVAGTVYIVENNDYLDTAEELAKIAGSESDQLIIWAGASSDHPDYSWTFTGATLDENSPYMSFDPTIELSSMGTGDVANIMEQANSGLVLEFAHDGELPGTASIYVLADAYFDDGTELALYCFDEDERCFVAADAEAVSVVDGYASFEIDHCSTWALSDEDLSAYEVTETYTPGAKAASSADDAADTGGMSPALLIIVIAALVLVVVIVAGIVISRRRATAAAAQAAAGQGDDEPAALDAAALSDGADAGEGSCADKAAPDDPASDDEAASDNAPADDERARADGAATDVPAPDEAADPSGVSVGPTAAGALADGADAAGVSQSGSGV